MAKRKKKVARKGAKKKVVRKKKKTAKTVNINKYLKPKKCGCWFNSFRVLQSLLVVLILLLGFYMWFARGYLTSTSMLYILVGLFGLVTSLKEYNK